MGESGGIFTWIWRNPRLALRLQATIDLERVSLYASFALRCVARADDFRIRTDFTEALFHRDLL
jgi:hypothetical protein